jgi:hypothetical protein
MGSVLSGLDLGYSSIKANASDEDGLRCVLSKVTLEKHNHFYDNSLSWFREVKGIPTNSYVPNPSYDENHQHLKQYSIS